MRQKRSISSTKTCSQSTIDSGRNVSAGMGRYLAKFVQGQFQPSFHVSDGVKLIKKVLTNRQSLDLTN